MFTERLISTRKARGLTPQQVADNAGMTVAGYYYYEKGKRQPAFAYVAAIADALGVSIDYLAGRTDNPAVNH